MKDITCGQGEARRLNDKGDVWEIIRLDQYKTSYFRNELNDRCEGFKTDVQSPDLINDHIRSINSCKASLELITRQRRSSLIMHEPRCT